MGKTSWLSGSISLILCETGSVITSVSIFPRADKKLARKKLKNSRFCWSVMRTNYNKTLLYTSSWNWPSKSKSKEWSNASRRSKKSYVSVQSRSARSPRLRSGCRKDLSSWRSLRPNWRSFRTVSERFTTSLSKASTPKITTTSLVHVTP